MTPRKRTPDVQKAATELGRDRAAIRRRIDIIMAAIGDDGVSR